MIENADIALQQLLVECTKLAEHQVSFDAPVGDWKSRAMVQSGPFLNCYLYSVFENRELATTKPVDIKRQEVNGVMKAIRRPPPVRVSCAYCITAWSMADGQHEQEEHRLLDRVFLGILRLKDGNANQSAGYVGTSTMPIYGTGWTQRPPFPTIVLLHDAPPTRPEFWSTFNQPMRPSLNYLVTFEVFRDEPELTEESPDVIPNMNHVIVEGLVMAHHNVKVPPLVGLLLDRAKVVAKEAGFQLRATVDTKSDVRQDPVIHQKPAGGESVLYGIDIDVVVAKPADDQPD